MIYGVSFSPELILSANADKAALGGDNYVNWSGTSAGGVTNEICDLIESANEHTMRFEFIGGITGDKIKRALQDKKCKFYEKQGENTLQIKIDSGKTTRFTGNIANLPVNDEEISPFVRDLEKIPGKSLVLIPEKLSGVVGEDTVKHVFSAVAPLQARVLFRADERSLSEVLKYSPYYLFADEKTLCAYFGKKTIAETEIIKAMAYLQKKGAQSVIVFGGDRMFALGYMGGIYKAETLILGKKEQARFIACFACACELGAGFEQSLKTACACASGADISAALDEKSAYKGTFTVIRKRVKKQVIRNVSHYVLENAGIPFAKKPLNLLDLTVLTQITMLDITKLQGESMTLREARKKYIEKNPAGYVDLGVVIPQSYPLLSLCADSVRFANVEITDRKSVIDDEKVVQFTAITFRFPTGEYAVAFNGTDDTIVGWKEDFYLLYDKPTESQLCAVKYLNDLADSTPDDAKLYVVGHSKGGNLSMYGAVMAGEKFHEKLVMVYNFDGPGFVESFYKTEEFLSVQNKILSVIPQLSVVGRLFNHEEKVMIVKSCFSGIYQHDLYSWETEGDSFVTVPHLDELSDRVQEKVNEIMYTLTPEQRKIFVDGLFSLLYSTDSFTLTQLMINRGKLFGNFFKCDAATRKILLSMMMKLMSDRYVREMAKISMREAKKMQDKKEFEESSIVSGNIDKAIESIGVIVDPDEYRGKNA